MVVERIPVVVSSISAARPVIEPSLPHRPTPVRHPAVLAHKVTPEPQQWAGAMFALLLMLEGMGPSR
jgi:hypothetical protein